MLCEPLWQVKKKKTSSVLNDSYLSHDPLCTYNINSLNNTSLYLHSYIKCIIVKFMYPLMYIDDHFKTIEFPH